MYLKTLISALALAHLGVSTVDAEVISCKQTVKSDVFSRHFTASCSATDDTKSPNACTAASIHLNYLNDVKETDHQYDFLLSGQQYQLAFDGLAHDHSQFFNDYVLSYREFINERDRSVNRPGYSQVGKPGVDEQELTEYALLNDCEGHYINPITGNKGGDVPTHRYQSQAFDGLAYLRADSYKNSLSYFFHPDNFPRVYDTRIKMSMLRGLWWMNATDKAADIASVIGIKEMNIPLHFEKQALTILHAWDSDAAVNACIEHWPENLSKKRNACGMYLASRNDKNSHPLIKRAVMSSDRYAGDLAPVYLSFFNQSGDINDLESVIKSYSGSIGMPYRVAALNLSGSRAHWDLIVDEIDERASDINVLKYIQSRALVKDIVIPFLQESTRHWKAASEQGKNTHHSRYWVDSVIVRAELGDITALGDLTAVLKGFKDGDIEKVLKSGLSHNDIISDSSYLTGLKSVAKTRAKEDLGKLALNVLFDAESQIQANEKSGRKSPNLAVNFETFVSNIEAGKSSNHAVVSADATDACKNIVADETFAKHIRGRCEPNQELPVCEASGDLARLHTRVLDYTTSRLNQFVAEESIDFTVLMYDLTKNVKEQWLQCQPTGRFEEREIDQLTHFSIRVLGLKKQEKFGTLLTSLVTPEVFNNNPKYTIGRTGQTMNAAIVEALWFMNHSESASAMASVLMVDKSFRENLFKSNILRYLHGWDSDAAVNICAGVVAIKQSGQDYFPEQCGWYLGLRNYKYNIGELPVSAQGLAGGGDHLPTLLALYEEKLGGTSRSHFNTALEAAVAMANIQPNEVNWQRVEDTVNLLLGNSSFDQGYLMALNMLQDKDLNKEYVWPFLKKLAEKFEGETAQGRELVNEYALIIATQLGDYSHRSQLIEWLKNPPKKSSSIKQLVTNKSGLGLTIRNEAASLIADADLAETLMVADESTDYRPNYDQRTASLNIQAYLAQKKVPFLTRSDGEPDAANLPSTAVLAQGGDAAKKAIAAQVEREIQHAAEQSKAAVDQAQQAIEEAQNGMGFLAYLAWLLILTGLSLFVLKIKQPERYEALMNWFVPRAKALIGKAKEERQKVSEQIHRKAKDIQVKKKINK